MITNYISIDSIIEKINRNHIPGGEWNLDEIKEWTYDALSKINTPQARIKSIVTLEVADCKTRVPADVEVIEKVINTEDETVIEKSIYNRELKDNTYISNGGYLYFNFDAGEVTLNYYTAPIDDEGFPLIPDDNYYISAIESFILYMIGKRSFWKGKILQNQLAMLEQEWLFYLPAAITSQKMDIMKDSRRFRRISNRHLL